MATQAEERGGLMQQVVGHGSVRVMADRTVLFDWSVLVGERSLFFGVTAVASEIDRVFLQMAIRLAVRIVTGRADHLAFTNGMVRWQLHQSIDLLMALVANIRIVD